MGQARKSSNFRIKWHDSYSVNKKIKTSHEGCNSKLNDYSFDIDKYNHKVDGEVSEYETFNNRSYISSTPFSKTYKPHLESSDGVELINTESKFLSKIKNTAKSQSKLFKLESFTVLSILGYGTFGWVLLVQNSQTDEVFAVKVIKKSSISIKSKQLDHIKREKDVLTQIKAFESKFYTTLYETLQDKMWLYFFLDFIQGGELHSYIKRKLVIPIEGIKFYMAEVVCALEQLHIHHIGNNSNFNFL